MRLSVVESVKISPRVTVRVGDLVRFGGGGNLYRFPGQFLVRCVYRCKSRFWLEVSGVDRVSGCHCLFVMGKPYSRHCVKNRPYKVRLVRSSKGKACQKSLNFS
jgi:hypothetical protein